MARRLALLIATYDYQDTGLRRLRAPAHDTEALAAVLQDPSIAGFDVTTLVNEPHHRVGEAIGDLYRDRRRDDLTLLYFSGHGLKDEDGRLYLAMANTRRESLLFTSLPAEQIDQAMSGCTSRQQVLILDCCYSGAFPAGRLAKSDTAVHALEPFQGRGRTVLTASDALQYSFEGNQVHGEAAQSVFTRHLVAGLRDGSADLDGDGNITLDELYSYVYDRVVDEMPQQRPKKQDNIQGRIVIARNIHWTLPVYLRNALSSPIATDRLAALDGLAHLHRVGNALVRQRVIREIQRLTDDDSRRVSTAASAQLLATQPQAPERPSPPASERASTSPLAPVTTPTPGPISSDVQAPQATREPATPLPPPAAAERDSTQPAGPGQRPPTQEGRQRAATAPLAVPSQAAKKITITPAERHQVRRKQSASPRTPLVPTSEGEERPPSAQAHRPGPAAEGAVGGIIAAEKPDPAHDTDQSRPGRLPTSTSPRLISRRRILIAASAAAATVGTPVGILVAINNPGFEVRSLGSLTGHSTQVFSMAFSPDGKLLASSGNDKTVRLWDVATRKQLGNPLTGHTDSARSVAFSPNGKLLASSSDDKTVRLWDVAARKQLGNPLTGHTDSTWSVAFSPNGKLLASGSADETVRLWDVATRKQLDREFNDYSHAVARVAFSPGRKLLASSNNNGKVRLWDIATYTLVDTLECDTGTVWSMAFSPNGKMLASGGKVVRLWDVATRKQLGNPLTDHGVVVWSVAFSPNGKLLASSSDDKTVRLWDVATRKQLGNPLTGHTGSVLSLAFSPDGKMLASGSVDSTVRLWRLQ
ncbi:caspase family protein [Streptomyces sp. NPDC002889]|uniref:caspase, EACC1-associated type n=1 Tax=Streptomyces sp. NPDC002889 TaxID=3364669 RepID=UPI0036CFEC4F